MHIVQLANFYGARSGGIRVFVDEVARRYVDAGHRVSLVIPDDHDSVSSEALGSGSRVVVRIRSPLIPGLGGYRMITNRAAVEATLHVLAPDVLELSDKTTLAHFAADARFAAIPTVLISHERLDIVVRSVFSELRVVDRAIARFNRIVAGRVDALVCCSEFAAAEFREHVPWAVPKIVRVPLGVDLNTFRPLPRVVPRPPISADHPLRIATVVRLSPEKQPGLVVATVRELVRRGVPVDATIYGDGPYRERLEEDARGLPITFAGHIADRPELAAAIGRADVAISPGPVETFGLGGLEVLACGTPVVVPDSGALPELIDRDCGRVAESNPNAFADAVLELVDGDGEGRRAQARQRALEFNWDRTAGGFLELYERLLGISAVDLRVAV